MRYWPHCSGRARRSPAGWSGDQVEVFKGGVQAFAQADVEIPQRGGAVDQKDGVIGSVLGAGVEAAGW